MTVKEIKEKNKELEKEICFLNNIINEISIILEKNKSKLSKKDYNYCFEKMEDILIFRINRINNEV